MIQIIRGVYGHYVTDKKGKTRVVARDCHSDPIELTEEQEARLVSQGVARYVHDAPTVAAPIGFDEQPPEGEEKPLEDLSAKELRERGKEYGLSFKVGMTKAEMIEALRGEWPQEEPDGAPTFDPAEAVL